jgi:hypothetical protein
MTAYVGVVPRLRTQHRSKLFRNHSPKKIHPNVPLFLFEEDREGISHLLTEKLDYYGKS